MKRKDIFIMIITFVLLIIIISLSYAYFVLNTNLTNNIAQNISFDDDAYQIEVSNRNATPITISNYAMMWSGQDELVANTTENFIINITNNLNNALYCTYDIVWEWKTGSGISNYTITSGATKEYTVSWDGNAEVQVPNYNASSFVLGKNSTGAIAPNGVTTVTVPIDIKFYNLANFNQSNHYNKTYLGYVKIDNIACGIPSSFADYIVNYTPRSGVDAVSNSPWILTSDREGEWRYAGKNPDNYIEFNGELWRIIGVMPNTTYCTGEYGTETECSTLATGDLVKIIRNSILRSVTNWDYKQTSVGSSNTNNGSNDWSDSQLMLMLNGKNYLKTGYDVNGNKLHSSYTITSNVVKGNGYNFYNASYSYLDGNGLNLYIPASATTSGYSQLYTSLPKKISNSALSKIATVRWDLYGTNSFTTDAEGSPIAFYNKERNIDSSGSVYTGTTPENRPVYWYGKVGLLYPSDYGYATNGDGSTSGSYSRTQCLERTLNTWFFSNVITSCAQNDWLRYGDITSAEPINGANKWLITPNSSSSHAVFNLTSLGYVSYSSAYITDSIYPVLYLKADTRPSGGNGTWNNPYIIE
ncbi:MAG: hypothetical protein IKR74_00095 [Bacilli bacterium]|nr:hypothetical protein [Bacilli bacterium]